MGSSASGGKEKLGGSLMGHNDGGENESECLWACLFDMPTSNIKLDWAKTIPIIAIACSARRLELELER
eukprot:scaffold240_cov129-Isochrysis_galbana.AAC.4